MKILAFDTCLGLYSIALLIDKTIIAEYKQTEIHRQAEELVPSIEKIIDQNNISYNELDCIAVTIGPGSFTGVRIGLAAALGTQAGINKPILIGISTLEALAFEYKNIQDTLIVPTIDAGRGQFYTQNFRNGGQISEPTLINAKEILAQKGMIVGDLSNKKDILNASLIAQVAENKLRNGTQLSYELNPLYVRSPDYMR